MTRRGSGETIATLTFVCVVSQGETSWPANLHCVQCVAVYQTHRPEKCKLTQGHASSNLANQTGQAT